MNKRMLSLGIVLILFLAGSITPMVETSTGKKIVTDKNGQLSKIKIDEKLSTSSKNEGTGLLTADLKIRESDSRWHEHSITAKVGTTLEFKIEVKPFLQDEYKNVYIFFTFNIYSDPRDPAYRFDYIEDSASNTDNLVGASDFFILWEFPMIKSSVSLTFKAKVTKKGFSNPAVLAIPKEAESITDIGFDIDEAIATKAKSKFLFNKLPLYDRVVSFFKRLRYSLVNKTPFFESLINFEAVKSPSQKISPNEDIDDINLYTDQSFSGKKLRKYNQEAKEDNIDTTINYFISAKDHPDTLDDSTIDDIAILKLVDGKDLDFSDIKIVMSSDRDNWVEVGAPNKGIWHVGENITIYELNKEDITSKYYEVRVMGIENNIPIAARFVNIDNSQMTLEDLLQPKHNINHFSQSVSLDFPDKSSSALWHGSHDLCISLGAEYYEKRWEPHVGPDGCWEYQFRLDGIYYDSTEHKMPITALNMYEDKSGIFSVTHPEIGALNLDENGPDNYDEIAIIACDLAIGALPVVGFPYSVGRALADVIAMVIEEEPDLHWEGTPWYAENGPFFYNASGFAICFVYVKPDTDWEIKFDLEGGIWRLGRVRLSEGCDQCGGKISFGERSPSKGDIDIIEPKPNLGNFLLTFNDPLHIVALSPGTDHVKFVGNAFMGDDVTKTDYNPTPGGYFECDIPFGSQPFWFGTISAKSYDSKDDILDTDPGMFVIRIKFS